MSEPTVPEAILGPNRYGKAETRVVHIDRDAARDVLSDLNVSVALQGDLTATHLTGDNTNVLPTDTQKNTVYAFARDGVGAPETFAQRLARHFVATQGAITAAAVDIESCIWQRLAAHSFRRDGSEVRTVRVEHTSDDAGGTETLVVSGVRDLVVLNTTGSEFAGFATDRHTTLAPAGDRVLATAIDARWRCAPGAEDEPDGWDARYARVRDGLLAAFADTYSRSLQQTLFAMGSAVIAEVPEVVEVRLTLPNRHHILADLTPFGRDNPNAVYVPADRPYGLIEASVLRAGTAADPGGW